MFAANEGVTLNDKLYVDDVFSTYLYTGNGSTQTINNGIDLAGNGGLVWTKHRGTGNNPHYLQSSATNWQGLSSNNTNALGGSLAFNPLSSGYSVGGWAEVGANGYEYVSWTFRKAPKFFDVVTYTGNGVAGRQIPHSLGVVPGMIVSKKTSADEGWTVYSKEGSNTYAGWFKTGFSASAKNGTPQADGYLSSSSFVVADYIGNDAGASYVAYLFAHDPSPNGLIQCGSFTTASPTYKTIVSLGWEPQYLLIKPASGSGDWSIIDNMRGVPVGGYSSALWTNSSEAENSGSYKPINLNPTGFEVDTSNLRGSGSGTYIYLAIRRPNKPPTTGTQVYNAIARTGTGAAATVTGVGFAPDLAIAQNRPGNGDVPGWMDRLRGMDRYIYSSGTAAEGSGLGWTAGMDGVSISGAALNASASNYINHFFKRAPGVFDVVCYTGDGTTSRNISHSLGVFPELVIVKRRSTSGNWWVDHDSSGAEKVLYLDSTNAAFSYTAFGTHTATKIQLETVANNDTNQNTGTYVAYLFASMPGISKVGSYTGNGSSQTINCGFTTGARFILIKRTDSTGDWYVWDSARGIVAANDPHLSLNTTTAEVTTDDSVDPDASGFIVNQNTATNINVSGASYIFLAIA